MNNLKKDKNGSFSFLFLLVYFKFGFQNYRDCKDISYEHVQICSNMFCHLKFEFCEIVAW
jgi:hypothetical protein